MSHNTKYESLAEKEDTVPIGSLNILSAKYEVRSINLFKCVHLTEKNL